MTFSSGVYIFTVDLLSVNGLPKDTPAGVRHDGIIVPSGKTLKGEFKSYNVVGLAF
jgi:hypothetical protein